MYDSAEYKRSRTAYIWQCTVEYFVSILVADAFLAKLLTQIGISDGLIGIISSFITLAFLFQLFSIFLVQKIKNVKKTAMLFSTLSQLSFGFLFLIPFLPVGVTAKTVFVICTILLAYFENYFVTSIIFKWCNSFVEPSKRASFSASKEMVSLITGMAFTLIAGYIIDYFEGINNIKGGFLFIAVSVLILSICNFVCLALVKKETEVEDNEIVPFKTVLKNTVGNRSFLNVIILTIMWDVARYLTIGFLGVFKTKDLLMSVGMVQIINMIANLARFALSKPFGKYSDKKTFAKGLELGFIIAAVGFAFNVFTTPATWWCVAVYSLMYAVSMCGINQNLFNITYSYVDSKYFVQASAIKNSIGGVCGFGASILGSKILQYIQDNNNMLFGIKVYGQQVLSLMSLIIIIAMILFVHFVISKQKRMIQ